MTKETLIEAFVNHPAVRELIKGLSNHDANHFKVNGLIGAGQTMYMHGVVHGLGGCHLIVANDREEAAYIHNDFSSIFPEGKLHFLPASSRIPFKKERANEVDILQRIEALEAISHQKQGVVIAYPQSLSERVITRKELESKTLDIRIGDEIPRDFLNELLETYRFVKEDFVSKPGDYAIRGGIIDIFSYHHDYPYRVEFVGDQVDTIRTFDPATQLSEKNYREISIVPDIRDADGIEERVNLMDFFPSSTLLWVKDIQFTLDRIDQEFLLAQECDPSRKSQDKEVQMGEETNGATAEDLFVQSTDILDCIKGRKSIEIGVNNYFSDAVIYKVNQTLQPIFNKNFDMLSQNFNENTTLGIQNIIASSSPKQIERLHTIFEDMEKAHTFSPIELDLHQGFIDTDLKIACYTDHQIFERFHRFRLKEGFKKSQQDLTLQDLSKLETGDFVAHVDHGIGKFAGLVKVDNNGKKQEAIKLIYRDNDVLYVSIHSLHRISRYTGKDGKTPVIHKIGSPAWKNTKQKTKSRIKFIAYD